MTQTNESTNSELTEVAHLYLMTIQQSTTNDFTTVDQTFDLSEVFDFNFIDITENNL